MIDPRGNRPTPAVFIVYRDTTAFDAAQLVSRFRAQRAASERHRTRSSLAEHVVFAHHNTARGDGGRDRPAASKGLRVLHTRFYLTRSQLNSGQTAPDALDA